MDDDALIDAMLAEPRLRAIEMVARPEGATCDEIVAATGWERHTTRGFLSRLGAQGNPIVREDRSYRFESLDVA